MKQGNFNGKNYEIIMKAEMNVIIKAKWGKERLER